MFVETSQYEAQLQVYLETNLTLSRRMSMIYYEILNKNQYNAILFLTSLIRWLTLSATCYQLCMLTPLLLLCPRGLCAA